jgi:uncharacterized protein (DUF488 family)
MESELVVFTVGHSTRTIEEFIELLQANKVTLVVDVRTVPHSRHNPQFNKENLPNHLKPNGIKYIPMPDIGGLRRPKPNSENLALDTDLRGYADFMQTKEFTEQLLKIVALSQENRLALMCSEALPWKCHRGLISDALVARHIRVLHIISKADTVTHLLNELAQVEGTKVTYPLYPKETAQRTLGDFETT